jgi:8-amino-7-oxononanoate synthase
MLQHFNTAMLKSKGLWRHREIVKKLPSEEILSSGQHYINFCSNDYLALRDHPVIKETTIQAIKEEGFGSNASPLLSGYSCACKELEEIFCDYLGYDQAIVFPSGYQANLGVVSALLNRESIALCDRLVHASVLDGLILSRAKIKRFKHNDVDQAQNFLNSLRADLLITESVFSMEGDCAPLADLSRLSASYKIPFLVDDAHGFGVIGKNGLGACEVLKSRNIKKPDILIIPFGKALSMSGAIVLADNSIIPMLLQYCRSYRYSTALSPAICKGVAKSFDIIMKEKWRLEQLRQVIKIFNQHAHLHKIPLISQEETPIRSIFIGDSLKAIRIAEYLKNKGMYVAPIRPPTVPVKKARIRISLTAAHKPADICRVIELIKEALQWEN